MSIDNKSPEIDIAQTITRISENVQKKIENENFLEHDSRLDYKPELPTYKREEIESYRQKSSEIKDSVIESTASINLSVNNDREKYLSLKLKDNPTNDESEEIVRLQINIERTSAAVNQIREMTQKGYELTNDILHNQIKDAMENYMDDKTGLYLMSVAAENSRQKIERWMNSKDVSPRNSKIIMTDMMLFHAANQRLGTAGLDDRLFTCMQGQIALSRFLDGEHNLYSKMSDTEAKTNKYIQKYFPKGSKSREQIEELKKAGIEISPFRINAGGGDEFGYIVEFTKEMNPDDEKKYEQLSIDIVNHVIESTSLTKNFDVIDEKVKNRELTIDEVIERKSQYRHFCDSINHLKFKDHPERGIRLSQAQADMNNFLDSLRGYFMKQSNNGLGQEILNPKINASMDSATIDFSGNIPTLEDGLMLTVYGKDSYLKTHEDNLYGLFNEFGNLSETKIDIYTTDVVFQLKNILSPEDLQNPEMVKKAIQDIIISDSIKNTFHILNEEVNEKGKHQKKTEVFLKAITGDIKSILTVGISEQSGRTLYSSRTRSEKTEIIQKIKNYYKKLIEENDQDSNLIRFKQDLESKNIIL